MIMSEQYRDKNIKSMPIKDKIVILTYHMFPCHEPVLEFLLAKELGARHKIVWLFDGGLADSCEFEWYNTKVVLGGQIANLGKISLPVRIKMRVCKWFKLLGLVAGGSVRIVMVRDMPLSSVFVALLAKIYKFKTYFQYTIPMGDIKIAYFRDNKKISTFSHYIIGRLHNIFLPVAVCLADIVFPITDYHGHVLRKYCKDDKYVTLSMGVDEDWIKTERKPVPLLESLRKRHDIITYFGTLSFARNPVFILEVFVKIRKVHPTCKLILIGQTAYSWEDDALKKMCYQMEIKDDVIFAGQMDRNELADYLAYSVISISAIPAKDYYVISSPTKLYESLGHGIPVVGNIEIKEQKKVIEESGGGIAVKYDVDRFASAVLTLLKDKNLRNSMADYGREYIIQNYTYKMLAKKISLYF